MDQGLIPQDLISRIRERIDITEVVSDFVTLSRTGQNLKGLCPFHAEKTPSFTVSPSRQLFHCFGCGAGGDVFAFLMKIEGTAFPDAVREVGRRTGIEVPAVNGRLSVQAQGQRERLEKLNQAAADWFHRNLLEQGTGRTAMAYLLERGIQRDTVEAFGLGVALPEWDGLIRYLSREGYTAIEQAAAGLAVARETGGRRQVEASGHYDRFRARLMFPIYDLRKQVMAFGGRVLVDDGVPKYLNSPETPLFNKSRSLYALERAREAAGRSDTLVIVEGYFDAIALHQAGIRNVAATLGTALTPDHIRTIRRFVSKLVLLFDPDQAGVRAALRTLDLFVGSGIGVRVMALPDGDDPDTFVRKQGEAAFSQLQERAPSLLDFAVEHSLKGVGSGTVEDRIRSVDEILRILQKTTNRIEKEECLRRVAERLRIDQKHLIDRYPELLPKQDRTHPRSAPPTTADRRFSGSPEERDLVHLLLQGKLNAVAIQSMSPVTFTVPACRRIVEIGLRHLDRDGRVLVRPVLDEALVDPECGPVATELSLLERHYDDLDAYVRGCLDTLERKRCQVVLGELIVQLRAAEQEGRTEDVRRLNVRVNELRVGKAGMRNA